MTGLYAAVGMALLILIAYQEWRYRCLVRWLDALGEMTSETINQTHRKDNTNEHQ